MSRRISPRVTDGCKNLKNFIDWEPWVRKARNFLRSAQIFRDAFMKSIAEHGYNISNMYSADETALFWKVLPITTLAASFETEVSGWECPNDRVILLVAANASETHKLPLMMIGKFKFPMAFRPVGLKKLPVNYKSQDKIWMNRTIFIDWYSNVFLPNANEKNPDPTRKKFGADAAPSGGAVAFSRGELCDYAFGYAAFPLWVSSCPFLGEQLTYVEGTQRSFR